MLIHHSATPRIKFAGTHLYTWVERGTVRVKCLAQEHNTMSPARARKVSALTMSPLRLHVARVTTLKLKSCNVFVHINKAQYVMQKTGLYHSELLKPF